MKIVVAIVLTGLLAFVLGLYFPWWTIAIASFFVGILVYQKAGIAFLGGFMGIFILWAGLALWIDVKNQGILSHKIAVLLPLGGNSVLLILATAILGALVAGMGAMSGSFLRSMNR